MDRSHALTHPIQETRRQRHTNQRIRPASSRLSPTTTPACDGITALCTDRRACSVQPFFTLATPALGPLRLAAPCIAISPAIRAPSEPSICWLRLLLILHAQGGPQANRVEAANDRGNGGLQDTALLTTFWAGRPMPTLHARFSTSANRQQCPRDDATSKYTRGMSDLTTDIPTPSVPKTAVVWNHQRPCTRISRRRRFST
ncbi:hypothetical protein IE81DRAFT_41671 [Ceraceosorus guamensis]|uniref:Uncharacterized protein n=1 Tax=Ceraceosorus guamensis TaxID=1522189 RepID=A0A316VPF7_9BASI|nr:hypothetical protein IE81DRAFT_41671 [Ceraceosorus guamensis]PWN39210.1 hypothetical protein IE81DRAFT_41671 [Ceraceosorus guamensis]